jgi:hypothetical protein
MKTSVDLLVLKQEYIEKHMFTGRGDLLQGEMLLQVKFYLFNFIILSQRKAHKFSTLIRAPCTAVTIFINGFKLM